MSIILGCIEFARPSDNARLSEKMLKACDLWPHDRVGTHFGSLGFLASKQLYNTPESTLAAQPLVSDHQRYAVVFDGRLDNRAELIAAFDWSAVDGVTDEALILEGFKRFGRDLGQHLLGDFAIAILDAKQESLFLIRDHMGVRPLFIARGKSSVAFASAKAALLELDWVDSSLNHQWIADQLTSTKVDHHSSLYLGIEALPPAHWVSVSATSYEQEKYWQLSLNTHDHPGSLKEHSAQFREILNEAVRCRLRSYSGVASEMSGGLDSTTIATLASKLSNADGHKHEAFSHVMAEETIGKVHPFRDETPQMDAVCAMNPQLIRNKVYSRGRQLLAHLKRSIHVHSGPSRSDLTLPGEQLLEILEDRGFRTLLSGFGGDQLVTSKGAGWEEDFVLKGDWQSLWRELAYSAKSLPRRIVKFSQYRSPFVDRLLQLIRKEYQAEQDERFDALQSSFAECSGYPDRRLAYPTRPNSGTVREREFDVIHSPHVAYRLEDSALGAASYGVDYRYPLLDVRLLQFCLDLPTKHKRHKGVRRIIIREASRDLLPDLVRLRDNKSGSTIPTVRPRLIAERQELLSAVERWRKAGELDTFVNVEFLKRKLTALSADNAQDEHVSVGLLIKLIMLGTWLEDRCDKRVNSGKSPI